MNPWALSLIWWVGLVLLVIVESVLNINNFILVVILAIAYGAITSMNGLYAFPFQYSWFGRSR